MTSPTDRHDLSRGPADHRHNPTTIDRITGISAVRARVVGVGVVP